MIGLLKLVAVAIALVLWVKYPVVTILVVVAFGLWLWHDTTTKGKLEPVSDYDRNDG